MQFLNRENLESSFLFSLHLLLPSLPSPFFVGDSWLEEPWNRRRQPLQQPCHVSEEVFIFVLSSAQSHGRKAQRTCMLGRYATLV